MFAIPNVPANLARELYAELCRLLPPPAADTPEASTARDQRAIAAVAALTPENHFEAELAVQIVAKDFHAKDALRAAARPNLTVDALKNYRDQASRMDRDSQSGVRNLLRVQAARYKAGDAASPAAMQRAGHRFKDSPDQAGPPLPPHGAAPPSDAPPAQPPRQVAKALGEADHYAGLYPRRAAAIRAHGGIPPNCGFRPPDAETVAAIVASNSPIMLRLDAEIALLPALSPGKTESRQTTSRDTDATPPQPASHPVSVK